MINKNDDASEFALLGCALNNPGILPDVLLHTQPADYLRENGRLLETMVELQEAGRTVSPKLVRAALIQSGNFEFIGGDETLLKCVAAACEPAEASEFINIVQERAIRRRLEEAGGRMSARAWQPQPVEELIGSLEEELRSLYPKGSTQTLFDPVDSVASFEQTLERRLSGEEQVMIPTGLVTLDEMGGLRMGEMTILGALPSTGKTSMALWLTERALEAGYPVYWLSVEMTHESLTERRLALHSGIPYKRIHDATDLVPEELDRIRRIMHSPGFQSLPIYIEDRRNLTPLEARMKVMNFIAEHGMPGLVVLDYIQLLDYPDVEKHYKAVGNAAKALQDLCKGNFALLVLSQMTGDQGGLLRPSQLRESKELWQHADVVWLLNCPATQGMVRDFDSKSPIEQERLKANIVLEQAKGRGLPTGMIQLLWDRATGHYHVPGLGHRPVL